MNDKRLNNEDVPPIKQGEIDAWNRGKADALRNKLLTASQKLSPKRAMALIRMYCDIPDVHFLSTRFDVGTEEVRRILKAFAINSVEDARNVVNSGIIKELDDAAAETREEDEVQRRVDQTQAQARLDEQQEALKPQEPTVEESDLKLAERRAEAQRKNKEDRLRQLVAEGLDPNKTKKGYRVPLARVSEFRKMIPHGVFQLQRSFGGSAKDIVDEIKRLAPEYDSDMLRP
jgi:hypothetical protein